MQGRIDIEGVTDDTALLQDPVLNFENGEVSVNDPNNQPKFIGNDFLYSHIISRILCIGRNARREFGSLTGSNEPFVGVEGGVQSGVGIFPNRDDGAGSIDGHWDTDFMPGELMVFAIDISGGPPPLSAVTVMSPKDLGYSVEFTQADDCELSEMVSSKTNKIFVVVVMLNFAELK